MIITIAIDTDEDKDGIMTLHRFVESMTDSKLKFILKAENFKYVRDMYEAARRRTAGEAVVCTDKPKRRGRKPKNFNKE